MLAGTPAPHSRVLHPQIRSQPAHRVAVLSHPRFEFSGSHQSHSIEDCCDSCCGLDALFVTSVARAAGAPTWVFCALQRIILVTSLMCVTYADAATLPTVRLRT